jgi:GDP-L-fucose synthase
VALVAEDVYGTDIDPDCAAVPSVPFLVKTLASAAVRGVPTVTLHQHDRYRHGLTHVDDLADAAVFLAQTYSGEDPVRIAPDQALSIHDVARLVGDIVGYRGEIVLDEAPLAREVGPLRLVTKHLDALGWQPKVNLFEGIRIIYSRWLMLEEHAQVKH